MSLSRDDLGVWLINLPRAQERRVRMEEQLARMGLKYRLFEAVDGKARREEFAALVDVAAFERNHGRALLWGEVGCYLSHLGVWKEFLDSGREVALVLEDDVVFHGDFLAALDLALAHVQAWDMLKLNRIRAKLPICQGRIGPYRLNAYAGPATGTGGYLVTRATVERLLPAMLPITRAVDQELNRFFRHDYRLFGLEPFPSHVADGGESTITGRGFADVQKPRRRGRMPYYRLKAANYLRRIAWLLRNGHALPRCGRDLARE